MFLKIYYSSRKIAEGLRSGLIYKHASIKNLTSYERFDLKEIFSLF